MPFMPKVPHIVGDDDDMSQADEKAEMLSDHSYDSDSETDEENSTDDEEDWSNTISYIVVTPEHEPEELITDSKDASVCQNEAEIDLFPNQAENHDIGTEELALDIMDISTKSELQSTLVCNSPQKDIDRACDSMNSALELHPTQVVENNTVQFNDEFQSTLDLIGELSPPPRRLTLRSASRTVAVKAEVVPAQPKNSRARRSKPRPKPRAKPRPKPSLAKSTELQVVKSTRKVAKRAKTPIKKPIAKLARPIDVTDYFLHVSSTLVRQRVNLLPFLNMRKRIDQLVQEAIEKTKAEREDNQNASF